MVKNNNKGYLKTLEAIMGLLILFGTILYVISSNQEDISEKTPEQIKSIQKAILDWIKYEPSVRSQISNGNLESAQNYAIENYLPDYGLKLNMSLNDPNSPEWFQNKENVYVNSLIITDQNGDPHTLILYLWEE